MFQKLFFTLFSIVERQSIIHLSGEREREGDREREREREREIEREVG